MKAIARKTENDGRQWYQVTFVDGGLHYADGAIEQIGVTEDGELIDFEGFPLDGTAPTVVQAIKSAIAAAA